MVDRRTRADQLGLFVLLAVVEHQREVDIAVRQVPRDVPARAPGSDLAEAEHVFVELGGGFEIGHFQRDVVDPRHCGTSYLPYGAMTSPVRYSGGSRMTSVLVSLKSSRLLPLIPCHCTSSTRGFDHSPSLPK